MKRCPICGREPRIEKGIRRGIAQIYVYCDGDNEDHSVVLRGSYNRKHDESSENFNSRVDNELSQLLKKWNKMK